MLAPMTVFSISAAKLQRPMARTRLFVSCGIVLILSQANDRAKGVRIVAVVDQACLTVAGREHFERRPKQIDIGARRRSRRPKWPISYPHFTCSVCGQVRQWVARVIN